MKYELYLNGLYNFGSNNAERILTKYFDEKKKFPNFDWVLRKGSEEE